MTNIEKLIAALHLNFTTNNLSKITIGNLREKKSYLKNVFIKPIKIKDTLQLSFLYRYIDKDVTKNFDLAEATKTIQHLLSNFFLNAEMYSSNKVLYYTEGNNAKTKLITKLLDNNIETTVLPHNKIKHRYINPEAMYLKELGVSTAEGKIKADKQHKYKQINKYVEIIEGIIGNHFAEEMFTVVDMGSGKGYLTFALYDYLKIRKSNITLTGIELREELVFNCNQLAKQCNFDHLTFIKGSIQDAVLPQVNMLIALHACDTATDDAIAKGIKANATYIVCAPCCHKQIRKQMAPKNALQYITKHGILLERQAEMVTDTIRALILEAYGYKAKVFDFIEAEHTPKNVLIVGKKHAYTEAIFEENMKKVAELKQLFDIDMHYLETIL